jgi:ferredoxin
VFNRDKSREWPNITAKGTPPADADQWIGVEKKFESVFGVPPPNQ